MRLELNPVKSLQRGLQPFLEPGETLRQFSRGTDRATVQSEALLGGLASAAGSVLGPLAGSLVKSSAAYDQLKQAQPRDFIVALTERRLLVVEIQQREFLGAIKQARLAQALPLDGIKWALYEKTGVESRLTAVPFDGPALQAEFQTLLWVHRAGQIARLLKAGGVRFER